MKVPYIINVGDKEIEAETIAVRNVRSKDNKVEYGVKIPEFIKKVQLQNKNYE
ncbi:MAG: His/Gly/Thr/Pro-type tRNA ligase C-terminal domain-containing protein [Candidatus Heimdallarchaeaceae archaeon]